MLHVYYSYELISTNAIFEPLSPPVTGLFLNNNRSFETNEPATEARPAGASATPTRLLQLPRHQRANAVQPTMPRLWLAMEVV